MLGRLLGNAVRQAAATFATLLLSIAASAITARYLGPAALGVFGVALWTRFMLLLVLDIGIGSAISKFLSELKGSGDAPAAEAVVQALTRIQIGLAAAAGLGLVILSGAVATFLGQPELAPLLPIVALSLALTLINGAFVGRLVGVQDFRFKTNMDTLVAAANLAGVALVARAGLGIRELLWLDVAISAMQALIMATRPSFRGHLSTKAARIDRPLARRIAGYCLGVFLITSFDSILWQRSEVFFLSRFTTTTEVALFNVAYSVAVVPVTLIPFAATTVLFPFLSEQFGSRGKAKVTEISARTTKYCVLVALPVGALLMALADPLVRLVYGEAFAATAAVLRVLLIGAVLGTFAAPSANVFLAMSRPGVRALWGIPTALLSLGLAFVLVPPFGALGAALGKTVSQLIHVAADIVYLRKAQSLELPAAELARAVAAAVPIGVGGYLATLLLAPVPSIVLVCVVCCVVYLPLLIWSRVLNATDFDLLLEVVSGTPTQVQHVLIPTIVRARRFAGLQA